MDGHEVRRSDCGTLEIIEKIRFLRDGFSASGFQPQTEFAARRQGRGPQGGIGPADRVALRFEPAPAVGVHQAELSRNRRQSEIRVVLAQSQPILRATAEHAVRLVRAEGDKVVNEDAKVRLVPLGRPRIAARHLARGVQPRQQPLGRRFLVARGAVDLAGEVQPRNRLRLKRGLEPARVEEVVLDGVAGPGDPRLSEALDASHQRELHFERQAGGYAVGIEFVRVEAFRLDENLVRASVGEPHHLVLDGRAIPRSDTLDFPGVHGRAVESAADDPVRLSVRGGDVTRHLSRMLAPIRDERHRRAGLVSPLRLHAGEVNGVAGDPRRGSGLQPVHGERQGAQACSEGVRGRISGTPASVTLKADMDASTKKRSRRQHDCGRGERKAHRRQNALDTAL